MNEIKGPFPEIKKSRRKIFNARILMKSFTYAFAILGFLFILLLVVVIGFVKADVSSAKNVPDNAVLYVNFDDMISEIRQDDLIAEITETPSINFYDLVKAINVAAYDPKIKAIVAEVNNSNLGMAQIQELRDTVKAFRSSGKKAYIYSAGMGTFGGGTGEYYLASAFDEIWMQPNTEIGMTGISVEVPFVKDILSKVGVTPEFYTRHEYKNAVANLMHNQFTPQHKQETLKMGNALFNSFIHDVSQDRKIPEPKLRELVDNAPILAEDGINLGLVDMVAYKPDMSEEIKNRTNNAATVDVHDYVAKLTPLGKNVPAVAFLVIDGTIVSGPTIYNPMRKDVATGSETIGEYLETIANNPDVRALVLRVNSPGGSYTASNEIWYAIKKLKQVRDIPVVVSMGDYAASGGYFVSLAGDYIFAEPSTLTGSIGVLGGKMVLRDLWKKLGVHWQQVNFGQNAGMLTANRPFSDTERGAFNKSLDNVYRDFTKKVSETRKISLQDLDKLARGRIWTGNKASEYNLVDELGGIDKAIVKAKNLAGIEDQQKFTVIYYPEPKSFAEKLNDIISSSPKVSAEAMAAQIEPYAEIKALLERLQFNLAMPPLKITM